jgi:hypothetical protein
MPRTDDKSAAIRVARKLASDPKADSKTKLRALELLCEMIRNASLDDPQSIPSNTAASNKTSGSDLSDLEGSLNYSA